MEGIVMAAIAVPRPSLGSSVADPDGALRYVARQPILDLQGKVYAYELLFRSGNETVFSADGEFATRTMIDNTVLFGLEKLTGSLPAFVNCTAEALINEQVGLLPPRMTVLEILETVEPVPESIEACCHLKSLGFRLALDDFVWKPSLEPLIKIVDYIKFDFILSGEAERRAMLSRLKGSPAALLAEKVETQQDYQRAIAEGFTLFQGYYFCRPTLLTRRKVPANQVSHIELLRLLQETPLDLPRASEAVKRDAALTYRLLRLVNSPACAMRQEIRSISASLLALGEDVFRRIATLAIASEINAGQPAEILRMAFVRARFCEMAAAASGLNTLEQYLMGMFSMLPAMLRAPMEEIVSALPLRKEIRAALLGEPNPERTLLIWLEANEQGDWRSCDTVAQEHGLNPKDLHRTYTEALVWAELNLSGSISKPGE
jgi:EAL and modified HD-GYP domain-containing signal transduction protein